MTFDEIPGARERIRNAVAELVEKSGLSQSAYAKSSGFSQHQVNAWLDENARTTPNFTNLVKIAELAKTTPAGLLFGGETNSAEDDKHIAPAHSMPALALSTVHVAEAERPMIKDWNAAATKVWEILKLYRPESQNWRLFCANLDYWLANAKRQAEVVDQPALSTQPVKKKRP